MPAIFVVPIPSPGHGASSNPASPPSGSDRSPIGESASHPTPQLEQPAKNNSIPAHSGSSNANSPPSRGKAESPFGSGNTPGSSKGDSSSPYSPPASRSDDSPLQPQHAAPGSSSPDASTPPTGNTNNSPVSKAINQPAQGNPAAEGLSTIHNTSTKLLTSTVPASPMESGVDSSSATALLPVILTQTLVPIPLNPEQTAQPAVSSSGPKGFTSVQPNTVATSAPFPANNGTATAGEPSGGSLSASSASGTGTYSPGNVTPFTGSARKTMGSSILALAVMVAAALFM
ncbi:MAG: hypothetical protein LQ337_003158 [Flavoplaca oasis]|nr:MAG: hypothetical protein LQ337_003158 [Flavoplaca oasis]